VTTAGRFRDLAGQDAYKILGVPAGATRKEISRARRERQRTAHPDHAGADDASKLINTAASVLLDDALRREYDRWRRDADQPLWDTAERGATAPPPRRPPAAPHRATERPTRPPSPASPPRAAAAPGPVSTPDPEPFAPDDGRGGLRTILLVLVIFLAVFGIALGAVSLLLP
jgi:curved DNA-binding protein CbpA